MLRYSVRQIFTALRFASRRVQRERLLSLQIAAVCAGGDDKGYQRLLTALQTEVD